MQNRINNKMVSKKQKQLLDWLDRFTESMPLLVENTRQIYRSAILSFILYLEKTSSGLEYPQAIVNREIIAEWLKEIREIYSLSTVMHWAGTLTRFLSFLENNGWVRKNLLEQLQKKYPKEGLKGIVLALLGTSPNKSLHVLRAPSRFTSPLGGAYAGFYSFGESFR